MYISFVLTFYVQLIVTTIGDTGSCNDPILPLIHASILGQTWSRGEHSSEIDFEYR